MKPSSYKLSFKDYTVFVFITIMVLIASLVIVTKTMLKDYADGNSIILKKEAKNISVIISEIFDYANQINSYLGNQIVKHGANDLNFILTLFRDSDKIQNKNTELFSWSTTDWVNFNNRQTVNSRLGIRKHAPDMSSRQYTVKAPKYPWTLQVSFPVLGNPSKTWVIPAGTGITDQNEKYLGSIVVGFNITEFTTKVEQKLGNSNVNFVVLDSDLNIVMQSVDNNSKDNDFYKKKIKFDEFRQEAGVLDEDIEVNNINYSHYQKMNKYPYIILTGFNKNFLHKEFNNLILPRIVEFICLTVFFLIILFLFKTRILSLLLIEIKLKEELDIAKQSAEFANTAKTTFLKQVSHDLRNYASGIIGLAKILIEDKAAINEEERLQYSQMIMSSSEEMLYFVQDLLDINQAESGTLTLGETEDCDVKKLIERMLILSKNFANKNHITIAEEIDDNMPLFKCNIRRFKQILDNLITNAIKYSKEHTTIRIIAKYLKEEKKIYIEVADSGIGMSEKDIEMALSGDGEKIDKSGLDRAFDSHGIGLPLVKKLVELHYGIMKIDSKKEQGTKVKLYLTFTDSTPGKQVKATINTSNKEIEQIQIEANKNKTILLVEDEATVRTVTEFALKKAGYNVKTVENGKEAIAILEKLNCDLIFMDTQMPVIDGHEATKLIREGKCFEHFKNYKTIPIIAFTGDIDDESVKKIIDSGMNNYLGKPSSKEELQDMINKYL